MRLWSLHPRYLDPQGLMALWRETLLAKAVRRVRAIPVTGGELRYEWQHLMRKLARRR